MFHRLRRIWIRKDKYGIVGYFTFFDTDVRFVKIKHGKDYPGLFFIFKLKFKKLFCGFLMYFIKKHNLKSDDFESEDLKFQSHFYRPMLYWKPLVMLAQA